MKIKTNAKIKYYTNWCIAYTDKSIINYYKSILPKAWRVNRQRYDAHLTVVRKGIEKGNDNWGYRDGEIISFEYEPIVQTDGTYFFLNAWSKDIEEIREKLGLPKYRFNDCYHITIGNVK